MLTSFASPFLLTCLESRGTVRQGAGIEGHEKGSRFPVVHQRKIKAPSRVLSPRILFLAPSEKFSSGDRQVFSRFSMFGAPNRSLSRKAAFVDGILSFINNGFWYRRGLPLSHGVKMFLDDSRLTRRSVLESVGYTCLRTVSSLFIVFIYLLQFR